MLRRCQDMLPVGQSHGSTELAVSMEGWLVCDVENLTCSTQPASVTGGSADVRQLGWSSGQPFGFGSRGGKQDSLDTADQSALQDTSSSAAAAEPSEVANDAAAEGASGQPQLSENLRAEASSQQHLTPRVFVVSACGRCVEFLRPGVYERYAAQHSGHQGVTELQSQMQHLTLHRFVHHFSACPTYPEPLPVAEGLSAQEPETIKAVRSLHVPKRLYPRVATGFALPRVAAARPPQKLEGALPPVLLMREFLVCEAQDKELLNKYKAVQVAVQKELSGDSHTEADGKVCSRCVQTSLAACVLRK